MHVDDVWNFCIRRVNAQYFNVKRVVTMVPLSLKQNLKKSVPSV